MDGWKDRGGDGWVDGWMDGWMDGSPAKRIHNDMGSPKEKTVGRRDWAPPL